MNTNLHHANSNLVTGRTRFRPTRIRLAKIAEQQKQEENDEKGEVSVAAPIIVLEGPVLSIKRQNLEFVPSFAGKKYQNQSVVTYVKALDFTQNKIHSIKRIEQFRRLSSLTLDHNYLVARSFEDVKARRLEHLSVAHNNIEHLEECVENLLKGFPAIRQLNLLGNPCVPNKFVNLKQYQNYRYYVICKLPKLRVLDGLPVTPVELKRIQGKAIEPPLQQIGERFISPLDNDDLGFNSVKEGKLTLMKNKIIPDQEWNPFYFILGERRLMYFQDEHATLDKPLGIIFLGGYQLELCQKKIFGNDLWLFSLTGSGKKKTYHFLTNTKEELDDWIYCFSTQRVEKVEVEDQILSSNSVPSIPQIQTKVETLDDIENRDWDSVEEYKAALAERDLKAARERIDKLASFSIDSKEIELGQVLGHGSFGVVHQGKCRGKSVAVKKLHEQSLSQDALADFANEIEIMTKIHHPHIILCLGACIEPGKLMIVTELMNDDLEQLITNPHQSVNLITRLRMAKDAALGINWLHCSEPMIIHRDVKPSNFLIDENYRVVVADFGLSEGIKKGASKWDPTGCFKGSLTFTAPEILKAAEFDERSDVYSFGIVLWVLYTKQLDPYPEYAAIPNQEFVDKIVWEKVRPKTDDKCPPRLKSLMEKCWAADFKERPNFQQIILELEELILELSIGDTQGREWWKSHFVDKERIRWNEFMPKFYDHLGIPSVEKDVLLLQAMFCGLGHIDDWQNPYVNIRRFGQVLDWFGPIEHGNIFLLRMRDLVTQKWFHGDINAQDSTIKLLAYGPGTFLVRFSFTQASAYSLVFLDEANKLKHQLIRRKVIKDADDSGRSTQVFRLKIPGQKSSPEYPNLSALIDSQPYLQTPCPGTQYVVLQRQLEITEATGRNTLGLSPTLKKSESYRKMKNLTLRSSFGVKPNPLYAQIHQ